MSGTLVVAEHLNGSLRDVTREVVTAAQDLPRPVAVAVIAGNPSPLVDLVDLAGVDEIVAVRAGGDEFENDVYQDALEGLIAARQPDIVVLGFTVNSMGFAPAVAAKLGLGFASDVFGISTADGQVVAKRSFYGAKVHADVELPAGMPAIVLLRPTVWAPAEGHGNAERVELSVETRSPRARHLSFVEAPVSDIDITTADFLVSIGRGIGDKENIARFQRLAEKMGATLSVSRPIVDAGWMPSARQVGQSGKTVKPKVYLAFGISGAVQHLAGMKTSGTIIAVNTDPEAAIFGVAHYGAVLDLFDVADELEKLY
jgi:electron transfer flavoprotein alpha subunit